MSTQPSVERRSPPYAPYRSWKNLIEKLRGLRPLPIPFDPGFWNNLGFSGAMVSVLRPSMQSMGLLNNTGTPSDRLDRLLDINDDQSNDLYREIMDAGFPGWSQKFDLERATDGQLNSYFSEIGVTGDTVAKCKSFFVGLAGDAGLTVSQHLKTRSASSGTRKRTANRGSSAGNGESETKRRRTSKPPPPPPRPGNTQQEIVELTSGGSMTVILDTNMWQLSREDESFILDIKHRIRDYNEAKGNPGHSEAPAVPGGAVPHDSN